MGHVNSLWATLATLVFCLVLPAPPTVCLYLKEVDRNKVCKSAALRLWHSSSAELIR